MCSKCPLNQPSTETLSYIAIYLLYTGDSEVFPDCKGYDVGVLCRSRYEANLT